MNVRGARMMGNVGSCGCRWRSEWTYCIVTFVKACNGYRKITVFDRQEDVVDVGLGWVLVAGVDVSG